MKISFVIPTRNRLDLLKRAIKSVVNQNYPNLELIVVNDASTDGTKEYLDGMKDVRAIHNTDNLGCPTTLNTGLQAATGDVIMHMDDDDISEPGILHEVSKHFDNGVDFVYGAVRRTVNRVHVYDPPAFDRAVEEIKGVKMVIPSHSIAIRRELINRVGMRDTTLKRCIDVDYQFRLVLKHGCVGKKIDKIFFNCARADPLDAEKQAEIIESWNEIKRRWNEGYYKVV